jgi:hypothetical protein
MYCDASSQSPVNINLRNVRNGDHLGNLKVKFDNKKGRVVGTLVNNGHAPELKVDKSRGKKLAMFCCRFVVVLLLANILNSRAAYITHCVHNINFIFYIFRWSKPDQPI